MVVIECAGGQALKPVASLDVAWSARESITRLDLERGSVETMSSLETNRPVLFSNKLGYRSNITNLSCVMG